IELPGVAARHRAAPARQAAQQHRTTRRTRSDLGQETRAWFVRTSLAHDPLAGGLGRLALFALRARACARRPWLFAPGIAGRRMAADRMARGRDQADQILALDAVGGYQL